MMLVEYLEVSVKQYEKLAKSAPTEYVKGVYKGKLMAYRKILGMLRKICDFVVGECDG